MIKNAFFIIDDGAQVWAIRDVRADQEAWLREFALATGGRLAHKPPKAEGVCYGVFGYKEFRDLMRDMGYAEAVHQTDDRHRFQVAG